MALLEFEVTPETNRERIIIYSWPGFGKTRAALSLPDTPKWGEIVYYACDEGSEFLGSCLKRYRKRVHVLKPDRDDPLMNFTEFAVHDWKTDFPKARTLVVDTYTKVMFDILRDCAQKGSMTQEKHFQFVTKGGTAVTIPNRSDYFAIQNISRNLVDLIFQHQSDMHIIYVMHEDMMQTEGIGAVGGPSHPGRQMALELPSKFNTVIRLTRDARVTPNGEVKMIVTAHTDSHGQYVARIREAEEDGNPMPMVDLDVDPVNLWQMYDSRDDVTHTEQEAQT